jgi:hypothetical protein
MDTTYILLLLTFLIFPLVALVIAINFRVKNIYESFKIVGAIFLIHNIFFWFGFSLRGDYPDYFIFSAEYFFFCFIIFSLYKAGNIYIKILRVLATVFIAVGFIIGCVGIFLFLFVTQDHETDMTFHFKTNDKTYETRRYSFGGATLDNTKYTFETYGVYKYLPFESKVDKTIFFDTESKVAIDEAELKITIKRIDNKERIIFKDREGNEFSKLL